MSYLFITARFSSKRLPGKCLKLIGNLSVIGHCILRAKSSGFKVIVCTGLEDLDNKIIEECLRFKCDYFQGDSLNKLQRWNDCFKFFNISVAHIIDADDPYFDTDEIKRSLNMLSLNDLDLVRTSNRSDSGFASVGLSITAKFMENLSNRAQELNSKDFDVIPWEKLLRNSDKWKTSPDSFLTNDTLLQMRLTLDYDEDLLLLREISNNFSYYSPRVEIEEFLIKNPSILDLNSFRTKDFLLNKKRQLESNFQIPIGKFSA